MGGPRVPREAAAVAWILFGVAFRLAWATAEVVLLLYLLAGYLRVSRKFRGLGGPGRRRALAQSAEGTASVALGDG